MMLKLFGVILTVVSCGVLGFQIAASYIKEIKQLKSLIYVLEYMENELTYRKVPLPNLCRMVSSMNVGVVGSFFDKTATLLESKISTTVESCVQISLSEVDGISKMLDSLLRQLGTTLGKFDIEGQVTGIRSVKEECRSLMKSLEFNQNEKIRSIKTLGVCAGAAVAILLV